MTIREAFKQYNSISVCWIWRYSCNRCGFRDSDIDEEYSFSGSRLDFENYIADGLPLTLDSEIDRVSGNRFEYLSYGGGVFNCPACAWYQTFAKVS